MAKILALNTPTPNFNLPVTADQTLSLNELKGKPVILAFYPADRSPVCSNEMSLLNAVLPEFCKHNGSFEYEELIAPIEKAEKNA